MAYTVFAFEMCLKHIRNTNIMISANLISLAAVFLDFFF